MKVAFSRVYLLSLLLIGTFSFKTWAQCPAADGSDMFDTTFPIGNLTIPVSDCTVTSGGTVTSTLSITIPSGAILTINADFNASTWFGGGGSITVEDGGQLIINGDFNLVGAADLDIQDGGSGTVTGDVAFGGFFSGDATVDGNFDVGGSLTLNGDGSLGGDGTVDVTDDIIDNGGDSSGFTGDSSCGGASCDPLPVELLSFQSKILVENSCQIEWSTATELNNEGFYLEKSLDNQNFHEIGWIPGYGTTNMIQQYSFTDNFFHESAYYRLLQIDYDGQFEYHPTIFVSHGPSSEVQLLQNPVVTHFDLQGSEELNFSAVLVSTSGKQVARYSAKKLREIENELNQIGPVLLPGVYILHLNSSEGPQSIRFIKK